VLLDEPYNGLSPLMIEKINLLLRQDAQHKGIIITDHNYENVIAIATKNNIDERWQSTSFK
jgi:ABC-type lipopolysaccharide export system ATPase subunit